MSKCKPSFWCHITFAVFLLIACACRAAVGQAAEEIGNKGNGPKSRLNPSTGRYMGHKWHIDQNHLMWWDSKPYVPFGGFGINPSNKFGLNTYNLWIDFDSAIGNPNYTRAEHKREIARRLKEIADSGGTCIVQFSMALPHFPDGPTSSMQWKQPESGIDASQLADPKVKESIFKVWAEYAPAVRNECVRCVVLWNEINVWRWPKRMSVNEYAELLSEYVHEAKRLLGDVPICFKIAGTWNAEAVIAGAAVADGLGFDVWFSQPDDQHARREIQQALQILEARQKKTTWFFIAEGGRTLGEDSDEKRREDYWAAWPPFGSKDEAWSILKSYAELGAKGFIYNGPDSRPGSKYRDSYRWLGELKPEITRLMIETKQLLIETPREMTAAEVIAVARADRRVQELLRGVSDVHAAAEFSETWSVWLVHFRSGDRLVGFASVSEEGKVLEVGGPEEGEEDLQDDQEPTIQQRIEALERELEQARAEGHQQEVMEILELLKELRADRLTDEDEIEELEQALKEAREQDNEEEVGEILELLEKLESRRAGWDDNEPEADLKPAANDVLVRTGRLALRFGTNGQVKALQIGEKVIPCKRPTVYRLNKERATVVGLEKKGNGVRVVLRVSENKGVAWIEGGDRIIVKFKTGANNATFGLGFPHSTKFHVPYAANLARIVDENRLRQEPFEASEHGFEYQLILAELGQDFVSISGRSDYRKPIFAGGYQRAAFYRLRHRGEDIAFEWTWRPGFPLILGWHDNMENAAVEYRMWMEKFFNIQPIMDTPGKWVDDLKLFITFDMWRSNGDIAHTYQHGIDLAKELHEAGAHGGIVFYIPGWCGMYDASYPDYTPKAELGGDAKFREMIDTFHKYGYRVMIHVLPWGADPFSPDLNKIKHLATKRGEEMSREELLAELTKAREQGDQAEVQEIQEFLKRLDGGQESKRHGHPPVAWPACYPPKESDYDSGKQSLSHLKPQAPKVTFKTIRLPRDFEAHITIGGIRFSGDLKLSTNFRSLTSPKGHLTRHDSYKYPYTFLLYEGENEVTLEFGGAEVTDLSRAWYRIHDAIYSDMIWTYPIVGMNTEDPRWVKLFTGRVVEVVREYGIDAMHVDAQHLWDINAPNMAINRLLKSELPGVVFSTEKPTEPSMTMFQLAQNGLVPLEELDQGQIEPSLLAMLIFLPYRRSYLHLCAADGFVPVATVCTVDRAPRPLKEEQLAFNRRRFIRSPDFGVVRNIRVNYRDYGLDKETKKWITSLYQVQ